MQDYDCLGITFSVSRNEYCIVQPSAIKLNAVFPTILSGMSFLDSVKYTLSLNSIKASGGFDEEKPNSMLKGVANEEINGCLPIYICPEHWEIAKLLVIFLIYNN
jgi:hypothetical protein